MTRYFIKKATSKHKGSLRKWAQAHKFISNGKINLAKAKNYAKKHGLKHRLKQINLAQTLRRVRKR
jgi:hypothetical protein